MQFDLRGLKHLRLAVISRRILWAGVAFLVVFPTLGVVGIVYGYTTEHGFAGWVPRLLLGVGMIVMFTGFGALFVRTSRCVAESVEVDQRGFRFDFGRRGSWVGTWGDPRLRLQVAKVMRADGRAESILLYESGFRRAYLTVEAYAELARQAQGNGLQVSESPSPRSATTIIGIISR